MGSGFASCVVEALFRGLGWLCDSEGSKFNPFMQSAVVLGVSLEIRAADLVVMNTQKRLRSGRNKSLRRLTASLLELVRVPAEASKLAG
eukprot:4978685-Amphidinium_carterae.1